MFFPPAVNQKNWAAYLHMKFVIVGGGLNGAAAAFQLSELAKNENTAADIILLERGQRDRLTGGSAGLTRITRKASFENPHVIPGMVEFSNEVLSKLGAVIPVDTILVGNNPRYLDNAVEAAEASQAKYERLTTATLKRIPYVNMVGFEGVLEYAMDDRGNGAGVLDPTIAVKRMLEQAQQNGAVVRFDTELESITENSTGNPVIKISGGETIEVDRVITATGAWSDKLLGPSCTASFHTKPKVLKVFWFKLDTEHGEAEFPNLLFKLKGGEKFASLHPDFATKHSPYDFSNPSMEEGIYMMQENRADGMYLKFGHIQPAPKIKEDPDVIAAREKITPEHERFVAHFVAEFLPGVEPLLPDVKRGRASFTETYLESFSNDFMPIIGPRYQNSKVIVMAGFSGIGAKFAVASGRCAALYALGRAEQIPDRIRLLFAPDRKSLRPKPPLTWEINGNLGAPGPDGTVQSPPCLDMGRLGEKAAKLYRNGYPANAGIPEARTAVANMYNRFLKSREVGTELINLSNVLIATGGATDATQIAIDHAKAKHKSKKRPVALLISPIYHLYIGQLTQSDFDVSFVDGADRYVIETQSIVPKSDAELLSAIRDALNEDTYLLFINSPRNPDGKIFSRSFLEGILDIMDHFPQIWIISDTIYRDVAPPAARVLTLFSLANLKQRARIYETDGTSKSVAKTMDRAAWLISDAKNIEEIALVSHLKRGRPALPQMLQIVSMDEYLASNAPNYGVKNSAMYAQKLAYVAAAASQVEGLHCSPYLGAYYGYLDMRAVDFTAPMTAQEKENAVVDALVIKGIAVSPGANFRHQGAIRFNSSFKNKTLQRLMNAIVDTFAELGARVTRKEIVLPAIDMPTYEFQDYPVGVLTTHR